MKDRKRSEPVPRFTVIIPSKNRAEYLRYTLRTCMMQNYERLEVVVSDDGSTENNREIVSEASQLDPRIRFVAHPHGGGMRENFEFALSQVKPGFVIALGGDDGLLPDGIQGMWDVLQETGTELLAWPGPIYSYPQTRGADSQLVIYRQKGVRLIDSAVFLRRQAKKLRYSSDVESPMFYVKGVASTKLVERVRDRSPDRRFYLCPTPDGFSGIVLAGEVSRFAFSGQPFSLFGLSPSSQGLAYLSNSPHAKQTSESFIRNASSRAMHRELAGQPYSPLIALMTADYLLTAQDLPGWPGQVPRIDYKKLLIRGLSELNHGLYGDDRICRELGILVAIAEAHGLGEFFRRRVAVLKRRRKHGPFEGTGMNRNAVFLNGRAYGLQNIFDAAHATRYLYQAYLDLNPAVIWRAFLRSLRYRLRSRAVGSPFPPEASWRVSSPDMADAGDSGPE